MLLRQGAWSSVWSHSGTSCPGNSVPWHVGTQAQSCLPQLSAGSCLFPLPIWLAPLGAVGAELWQPLVLGCPQSREIPREGAGFIQQMGRPFLNLGAGLWEVSIPISLRTVPGRWPWLLGAFPLARGVSRAQFDCDKNGWAGHCCCILLLPCSPCLLSFVWVPSCSDLPPSAALAAALQGECSTWELN